MHRSTSSFPETYLPNRIASAADREMLAVLREDRKRAAKKGRR